MGPEEFMAPDRDEIELELISLLRNSGMRNHRAKPVQLDLLTRDEAPTPSKLSPGLWPAFKGPLPQDTRNLGKSPNTHKARKEGHYQG